MDVHLLHFLAGRLEVLAGIEVARVLSKILADGAGHGQTAVGVDVDLADGALGGLAELLLGDTDSVRQVTAVLVAHVDILLRDGGRAVEDDREAGELLFDLVQDVEGERRGNQTAGLRVAGALLRGELVGAVGGADGDGEGVAAGASTVTSYL